MKPAAKTTLALIAVGLLYVGLLSLALPLNGLWSGDQGAKLVQVISLLRSRFQSAAIPYPGATIDPAGTFSPLGALYTWPYNGQSYSIFPYAYAALTAIPFFFLGYPGLYVVPVLATLATAAIGAALGRRLGLRVIWAIPLLFALSTPLSLYAMIFWEHALATALALGALLVVSAGLEARGWVSGGVEAGHMEGQQVKQKAYALPLLRFALAGLLMGGAWWIRAEALWLTPALLGGMALVKARRRELAATAGGALLAVGAQMIFNIGLFGQPLGPQVAVNYSAHLADPGAFLTLRLQVAGTMLIGLSHWAWAWGLAWACALAGLAWPRRRPLALAGLAACALVGLLLTLPRDLYWTGLANTAPLALLALWEIRGQQAAAGQRAGGSGRAAVAAHGPLQTGRLLLWFALIYSAGVLLSAPNGGGAQWGPRYLLPALPALLLLGLRAAQGLLGSGASPIRAEHVLARAGLAVLLLTSLATQLRGVDLLQSSLASSLRIVQVANVQPMRVLVSDAAFGPQLLAPLYYERPILFVAMPEGWPALRERLMQSGEPGFVYLTAQPRDQASVGLKPLGIGCELIEGMAFGLNLLTCRID